MKNLKYFILLMVFVFSACHDKGKTTSNNNNNNTNNSNGTNTDPTNFNNVGKNNGNGNNGNGKIRRPTKVSKSMAKKFNLVLNEFYALASKGWDKDSCNKVADKFKKLAKEPGGKKIVTFIYNAGVTYSRCNMKDKAKAAFKSALAMDSTFPPARMALIVLEGNGNPQSILGHEKALMSDNYSLQDPDVNYDFALAYFNLYKKRGRKKNMKKFLEYLRRALANMGKIDNKTLEAVRIRMDVYSLAILFYLEAARRHDANLDLANVFIAQARGYIKPCSGKLAIKDMAAKKSLSNFHNVYGLLRLRRGKIGRAFESFKSSIACNPDNLSSNLNIGMLGIQFREPELAIKSLELVIKKYPSSNNIKDTNLALAVAYKVYGMKLQDMADNQFENKDRLETKIKKYKFMHNEFKKGLKICNDIMDGKNIRKLLKKVQPYMETYKRRAWPASVVRKKLDKGEITVKQIKDEIKKLQSSLDTSVNDKFPKAIAALEKELQKLSDVNSLRAEAKKNFLKSKAGYERYMARYPKDYRAVYNLAILLYKAGDLIGNMNENLMRARSLFEKLKKMKSATRAYRAIAKKHSADIKSTLVRLKESKNSSKSPKKVK